MVRAQTPVLMIRSDPDLMRAVAVPMPLLRVFPHSLFFFTWGSCSFGDFLVEYYSPWTSSARCCRGHRSVMNFIDTRCVERKEDAVQFGPNSAVAAFRALRPNPAEAEKLRKETEMRLRHRTSRNRVHAHENA